MAASFGDNGFRDVGEPDADDRPIRRFPPTPEPRRPEIQSPEGRRSRQAEAVRLSARRWEGVLGPWSGFLAPGLLLALPDPKWPSVRL
jgi:hypothetical protein